MRKSTLDEAPALFQVATLFSLFMWMGERPLELGELGGDQVLVTWLGLFYGVAGGRLSRGSLGDLPSPSVVCCWVIRSCASRPGRRSKEASGFT